MCDCITLNCNTLQHTATHCNILQHTATHLITCVSHVNRETMGLEGGVYLYHRMTPPSNLGHFWVILEGWSQILPSTKLFRHGFEQSNSAMETQKLEEKVQQYDEVVESSESGCRSQSRLLQPVAKHTSKCHVLLCALDPIEAAGAAASGKAHEQVPRLAPTAAVLCRSRAHGKAYEQVPALICDTCARRIFCAATIWGG